MKDLNLNSYFKTIAFGCMLSFLLSSCIDNDNELGLISVPEPEYSLPQGGNEEADERIMALYEKYNTYFIYDFNPEDAKWSLVTGGNGGSLSSSTVMPARTDYLVKQLDLIDECFLRYYPENFLKKYLPYKVFMASTIETDYGWGAFESTNGYTSNSFVFAYGYEKLDNMTIADKYAYFNNVNRDFLLYANNIITPPEEFANVSDYNKSIWSDYQTYEPNECRYQDIYIPTRELLEAGFLDTNMGMGKEQELTSDYQAYINYMRYFSEDSEQWKYYLSFPKVKTKYDALRNYCINTLGFDPCAFGNVNFE